MKTTRKIYIIAIALTCSLSAALKAQVYVVNADGNSIGEYGLDGLPVNTSLIKKPPPIV
ncbi:MAG TPA: hypothetical protein VMF08_01120 [Candidatus Sulfotelmatobacter sp.]|nr:hypothetical protein [Candidatus Sulfotelmatobacter sp.]